MANSFSFSRFKLKDIRILSLVLGGSYAGFGLFALFIVFMQKKMMESFGETPNDPFFDTMSILHEIFFTFMPLLALLGAGYLLFGLLLKQLGRARFAVNLVLGIGCLTWAIMYSLASEEYFESFQGLMADFPVDLGFDKWTKFSAGSGFVMVFGLLTIPQLFIGIWCFKYKPEVNEVT